MARDELTEADLLLASMNPEDIVRGCRAIAAGPISIVEQALGPALGGSPAEVVTYVLAYQDLVRATSRSLARTGSLTSPFAAEIVADQAAAAPFDVWAGEYGAGLGVAMYAVEQLRPGGIPHPGKSQAVRGSREAYLLFRERIEQARRRPEGSMIDLLEAVRDRLELSATELGNLFGVSRQAITKWFDERRVPGDRQAKLTIVHAIVELLSRHLKVSALSGIVRAPADDYGGTSMLDMIAADRHEEVLDGAREAFDYSRPA